MWFNLDKFYGRSPKWRKVRADHIKKNPTCAACGRKDNLEVHHIVPYHLDPEKELDPSNLITLCGKYCHFVFGHLMDWKSWNENVIRDCTLYNISITQRPYRELFGAEQEKQNVALNIINNCFSWLNALMQRRNNKS